MGSGLFIDIGPDDAVRIGEDTFVLLERKSGSRARLRILGSAEVELMRKARLQSQPPAAHNPPRTDTGD